MLCNQYLREMMHKHILSAPSIDEQKALDIYLPIKRDCVIFHIGVCLLPQTSFSNVWLLR